MYVIVYKRLLIAIRVDVKMCLIIFAITRKFAKKFKTFSIFEKYAYFCQKHIFSSVFIFIKIP
jgi:hypothetical protein